MGLMSYLRRKNDLDEAEEDSELTKHNRIWFCEKEIEAWFEAHHDRRLPQALKNHLASYYDLDGFEVLNASKRVHRRLN